jgi:hypothetical protein
MSLSQKNSCAQKNSMGYAKKSKRKISMPKGVREKKCMPKSMKKKKRKREERNKDSLYFQIRGTHPKREIHDSKEYQKNI